MPPWHLKKPAARVVFRMVFRDFSFFQELFLLGFYIVGFRYCIYVVLIYLLFSSSI